MRLLPYLCISDTARPKCSFAEFYAESRAFPAVEREERLMKRPVIGVMPLYDDEKDSFWMVPGYFEGLEEAGAIPLMFSPNLDEEGFSHIRGMIDGYLFTGGHDVNPALYGDKPVPEDEAFCDRRDRLEMMVFKWCDRQDIPALGICRGIQLFNVARGGTLWQDIPSQFQRQACGSSVPLIRHTMAPPYDENHVEHLVRIARSSPLHQLLKLDEISVNSYHHQAVRKIGSGLVPMAWSDDGLVEALYAPSRHFLWAVQWHPEFMYREDKNARLLFSALAEAAGHA